MKYRTVLFDLDGTLADTKPGVFRGVKESLSQMGITPPPDERLTLFLGPPLLQCFTEVCGLDRETAQRAIVLYRRIYEGGALYECSAYPGIENLLADLKASGATLGVATSKADRFARTVIRHIGLAGYFDAVCGSPPGDLHACKADSIRSALAELGQAADASCVLVGDRRFDAEGAQQTGVDSIGVLYGYGPRAEIESSGFSSVAEDVAGLRAILL